MTCQRRIPRRHAQQGSNYLAERGGVGALTASQSLYQVRKKRTCFASQQNVNFRRFEFTVSRGKAAETLTWPAAAHSPPHLKMESADYCSSGEFCQSAGCDSDFVFQVLHVLTLRTSVPRITSRTWENIAHLTLALQTSAALLVTSWSLCG